VIAAQTSSSQTETPALSPENRDGGGTGQKCESVTVADIGSNIPKLPKPQLVSNVNYRRGKRRDYYSEEQEVSQYFHNRLMKGLKNTQKVQKMNKDEDIDDDDDDDDEELSIASRWVKTLDVNKPKLKLLVKRYDPYAFLDAMTTPFDLPMDPKKLKDPKSKLLQPDRMPHCKACTDFKTWMQLTANPRRSMSREERERKECPLDSELLGRNTWSFLHTMAAYYDENPTPEQQSNMTRFIGLLSQFYPCKKCATNLREHLKTDKPDVRNNWALSVWMCELHNDVNDRQGKPPFDCTKVFERWRDGWADNSCE